MIRKAKKEDVRSVAEFMKQFELATDYVEVNVDHTTEAYEKLVETGFATLLILEKDEKMIGGLGFVVTPNIHSGKKEAVETYWFVKPGVRGGGIKLLIAYENEARKQGCVKVAMIHLVDSYPEVLEKIYERRHYVLCEKHYVKELS